MNQEFRIISGIKYPRNHSGKGWGIGSTGVWDQKGTKGVKNFFEAN
jgi:hypothetical protein